MTPKEDLLQKVNELASDLDVPVLTQNNISAIHRLPAKADKVPGIIVRYHCQKDRDVWLAKRKKPKETKNN